MSICVYLDTSVIIAGYKPGDPDHIFATKILKSKFVRKIISYITVVELSSVLSRLLETGELVFPKKLMELLSKFDKISLIIGIIKYLIKKYSLEIAGSNRLIEIPMNGIFSAPIEIAESIRLTAHLRLKTLDAIHVSIVNILKRTMGVEYFVTSDKNILQKRNEIRKQINVIVMNPKEFVNIFGL